MVSVRLGTKVLTRLLLLLLLVLLLQPPPPRHSHTPDTDTLSSTHITAAPAPTTKIYVSSLIFQSLSSPST